MQYLLFYIQFATNMEKNKLFIRGLPFKCTKQDVEKVFCEVRITLDVYGFNDKSLLRNISEQAFQTAPKPAAQDLLPSYGKKQSIVNHNADIHLFSTGNNFKHSAYQL